MSRGSDAQPILATPNVLNLFVKLTQFLDRKQLSNDLFPWFVRTIFILLPGLKSTNVPAELRLEANSALSIHLTEFEKLGATIFKLDSNIGSGGKLKHALAARSDRKSR